MKKRNDSPSKGFVFDNEAKEIFDLVIQDLYDDDDAVIVIVGSEGAGKSILAQQIYGYFAEKIPLCELSVDYIHFDGQTYIDKSLDSKQKQVNILDESRRALNKMRTNSSANQNYNDFLSECRSQNQIHLILLPAFSDLDRYVAVHRSKLIIKVHKFRDRNTGRLVRGHYSIYGTANKNLVSFAWDNKYKPFPRTMLVCNSQFKYESPINLQEYNDKKEQAKKDRYLSKKEEEESTGIQRVKSALIDCLKELKRCDYTNKDIVGLLSNHYSYTAVMQMLAQTSGKKH